MFQALISKAMKPSNSSSTVLSFINTLNAKIQKLFAMLSQVQ